MLTCISCGRDRGRMGWFSWHECEACTGQYCPDCFGKLEEAVVERPYPDLPARTCGNCGSPVMTPAFLPKQVMRV